MKAAKLNGKLTDVFAVSSVWHDIETSLKAKEPQRRKFGFSKLDYDVLLKYFRANDSILLLSDNTLSESKKWLNNAGFNDVATIDCSKDESINALDQDVTYSCVVDVEGQLDHYVSSTSDSENGFAIDDVPTKFKVVDILSMAKQYLKFSHRCIVYTHGSDGAIRQFLTIFSHYDFYVKVHEIPLELSSKIGSADAEHRIGYLMVATKLKPLPGDFAQTYEFVNGSCSRKCLSIEQLLSTLKDSADHRYLCTSLQTRTLSEEVSICLDDVSTPTKVSSKYQLNIVDLPRITSGNESPGGKSNGCYGVLIVTPGREKEWMFSDASGRRSLAESVNYDRLAIVRLCPGHDFSSLDGVKADLNPIIMSYAPLYRMADTTGSSVPYLTPGSDDVGTRMVVCEGTSAMNGAYFVEDILQGDDSCRRLIFRDSQNVVQSEAKLIHPQPSSSNNKKKKKQKPQPPTALTIDHSTLCCNHHKALLYAIHAVSQEYPVKNVCLVGLGGGCLAMHIVHHLATDLAQLNLISVEIDPELVEVARKHFGMETNDNHTVHIGDGVEFLENKANSDSHFDSIMLDVAGSSHECGISGPPAPFLTPGFINCLHKLTQPNGVLAVNIIARDLLTRREVMTRFATNFPHTYYVQIPDEVNCVLLALHNEINNWDTIRYRAHIKKFYEEADMDIVDRLKALNVST